MSDIAVQSFLKPTTEAEVLGLWAGPSYDSLHPGHQRIYEEMRQKVRDLAARMRRGDELWWYDQDDWTGVAVVRAGAAVDHVPLHETIIPYCYYELIVHFAGARATAKELMALRKLSPALRDMPLQSLVSTMGDCPKWSLGRFYPTEVDEAERKCQALGLRTERV
jgi:hypothetical protein